MEKEFNIAYRIMVMGILEPFYSVKILAYAFDLPEEQVETILDYYHLGARKVLEDSIRILIQDQGLTDEDIHELFSTIDLKKESIDKTISIAHGNQGTELPDVSVSEVCSEAFRTGYIYMSSRLFHELKIRTESTIEEINALFSMNPDMDRFISKISHTTDEIALEEQTCGEFNYDDSIDSLNSLVGPEVTARLNEYRVVGELNRELRKMPEDIRYTVTEILNNNIIPMIRNKASNEEIMEAALKAFADAGLMGEASKEESEDRTE